MMKWRIMLKGKNKSKSMQGSYKEAIFIITKGPFTKTDMHTHYIYIVCACVCRSSSQTQLKFDNSQPMPNPTHKILNQA